MPCIGTVFSSCVGVSVAELQDFLRFASPRQLIACVGLVPGEHSYGPKRRQGSITKAGNSAARRMFVELAWRYQHDRGVTLGVFNAALHSATWHPRWHQKRESR